MSEREDSGNVLEGSAIFIQIDEVHSFQLPDPQSLPLGLLQGKLLRAR